MRRATPRVSGLSYVRAPRWAGPRLDAVRRIGILDVAAELLVSDGLAGLRVEAVAARAQVESSLIDRWCPSEDALALDTLLHVWLGLALRVHHGAAQVGL